MNIHERTKVRALRNIQLLKGYKQGETFSVPSYEVKALVDAGMVEVVKVGRPAKGA